MSTTTAPGEIPASSPASPSSNDSTALPSASISTTTSLRSASWRGSVARCAPVDRANASATDAVRLNTATSNPASISCWAIGAPIRPRPAKPTRVAGPAMSGELELAGVVDAGVEEQLDRRLTAFDHRSQSLVDEVVERHDGRRDASPQLVAVLEQVDGPTEIGGEDVGEGADDLLLVERDREQIDRNGMLVQPDD